LIASLGADCTIDQTPTAAILRRMERMWPFCVVLL